ncbi:MAG: hypothetical protein R2712_00060 [Vicinamibacterales bacterium]
MTPLARDRGAEIGVRTVAVPRTQVTVSLWRLALDSEQVFVGDAGTTAAGRPSRRGGVEVSIYAPACCAGWWLTATWPGAAGPAKTGGDGPYIPGAVGALSVPPTHRVFGGSGCAPWARGRRPRTALDGRRRRGS